MRLSFKVFIFELYLNILLNNLKINKMIHLIILLVIAAIFLVAPAFFYNPIAHGIESGFNEILKSEDRTVEEDMNKKQKIAIICATISGLIFMSVLGCLIF